MGKKLSAHVWCLVKGFYEEQFHDVEVAELSCEAERHVWQELVADQVQC